MSEHQATAILKWHFDGKPKSALEEAKAFLQQILNAPDCVSISLKVEAKESGAKIILGEFLPSDVLPFLRNDQQKRIYYVGDTPYEVRMNSHRYFIFLASSSCAACGLQGTKMLLEQHPHDKSPHFNLYAEEDGELVLMTKDHIRAKSFGGEDRHSNYQTMCSICNNLKGNDTLTLASLRRLRDLYNKNSKVLSRKRLNSLINSERERLKEPGLWDRVPPAIENGFVVAKVDLAIMKNADEFVGMSIYEAVDKGVGMQTIACVPKGALLKPISSDDQHICVEFNETHFKLFTGYVERPNS